MIIDHKMPPNMRVIDETLLYTPYPSGLLEYQKAIHRYTHSNSKEPILRLKDYIYDYNGNHIAPGMYSLALSDSKEFLLLIQSHDLVAVIPVFKLAQNQAEVDRIEQEKKDIKDRKKGKKLRYKEKINKIYQDMYEERSVTPPEKFVYMNATIEYVENGGYYLITYENGMWRAWGAIKTRKMGEKTPIKLRN